MGLFIRLFVAVVMLICKKSGTAVGLFDAVLLLLMLLLLT
jgi:hypothetical protein